MDTFWLELVGGLIVGAIIGAMFWAIIDSLR